MEMKKKKGLTPVNKQAKRLDEEEALRTLELFRQLGEIMEAEPGGHD